MTTAECGESGHGEVVAIRDGRNPEVGYVFCRCCRVYTAIEPTDEAALEALLQGRIAYAAQPKLLEEAA